MDRLRHLGQAPGCDRLLGGAQAQADAKRHLLGGLGRLGHPEAHAERPGVQRSTQPHIGRQRPERDEDGNTTAPVVSMWADLPPLPDQFLEVDITFELEPHEAEFLVDRIRLTQPDSLLAVLSGDMGAQQEPVAPAVDAPTSYLDEPAVAVPQEAVGPRCQRRGQTLAGPTRLPVAGADGVPWSSRRGAAPRALLLGAVARDRSSSTAGCCHSGRGRCSARTPRNWKRRSGPGSKSGRRRLTATAGS